MTGDDCALGVCHAKGSSVACAIASYPQHQMLKNLRTVCGLVRPSNSPMR